MACPLPQKDWATLLHFIYHYHYLLLQITLLRNYSLPTTLVLAEITLLKTTYHFLLLPVGFDTLTYQKDYDRSPILVGHHSAASPFPLQGKTNASAQEVAGTRWGGAPTPPQARPPPSWGPSCSTNILLPPIYTYVPPNYQNGAKTLIPPP